jgi:NAD+ synthase (glutamine-hydrolysing)
LYKALTLGIRDYFKKTGFGRAIIGLSGGIDSALTAVLAAEALGSENVLGISMPSQYSSEGSVADSRSLAQNLGIELKIIPITSIYNSYMHSLKDHLAGWDTDVTEENIQARIRGNLLMALSNKYGAMVLSTGNKSEMAVGYCTLYGDMCGGLSVLSDVPKTMVYELSRYINREKEIIPAATLKKDPSAELRPNQKDKDILPPYEILDGILNYYIEGNLSTAEIVSHGYDADVVKWVVTAVNRNEYKRKQAAPGLKVSRKAFGAGRRMPVAARFEA